MVLLARASLRSCQGTRNQLLEAERQFRRVKLIRKRMEELMIQRQKRIAERSSSSSSPATLKRTSSETKSPVTSKKNGKTEIQSPTKESAAKVHKPVFRSSTMDRLATARVTQKVPSTQTKSDQPKKAVSKGKWYSNWYITENCRC